MSLEQYSEEDELLEDLHGLTGLQGLGFLHGFGFLQTGIEDEQLELLELDEQE